MAMTLKRAKPEVNCRACAFIILPVLFIIELGLRYRMTYIPNLSKIGKELRSLVIVGERLTRTDAQTYTNK